MQILDPGPNPWFNIYESPVLKLILVGFYSELDPSGKYCLLLNCPNYQYKE
jgi:hypothetical protein